MSDQTPEELRASEEAERLRVEDHERALSAVRGIISDALSPFNDAATIKRITAAMNAMPEMSRDWEEYRATFAEEVVTGRLLISARLSELEAAESPPEQDGSLSVQNSALVECMARAIGGAYDGYCDPKDTPTTWAGAAFAAREVIMALDSAGYSLVLREAAGG